MKIKICGITDERSARAALAAGADALGFVFAESPRRIEPAEAARIAADLPTGIERVAVMRLPSVEDIRDVLAQFAADRVQTEATHEILALLGKRCLPVLHDGPDVGTQDHAVPRDLAVVLEGPGRGGRGVRADWMRARLLATGRRLHLAGGLHPGNVAEAIETVRPWGVDVSSGVESSPGVKSELLMRAFVSAARSARPETVG
jgi:phosphoribosylanthranilate isomerase